MKPLIHSILEGTCTFIQDFHEKEFVKPNGGEAIIESIVIVVRGGEEENKTFGAIGKE